MGTSTSKGTEQQQQQQREEESKGFPVLLHVYSPTREVASIPGFGVYHSGVEVHGVEYSYRGSLDSDTGVYAQRPKEEPVGPSGEREWRYMETVPMGVTLMDKPQLREALNEMRRQWRGLEYDIISRNCNHFADAFCRRITADQRGIPAWVNRAARVGTFAKRFVNIPSGVTDQGASNNVIIADDGRAFDVENADLAQLVVASRAAALNVTEESTPLGQLICSNKGRGKGQLASDADEQLLLFVPFSCIVAIQSITLASPSPDAAPKTVKLFVNKPNLDFDEASETSCTHELKFSAEEFKDGKDVVRTLPLVKFQRVSTLTLLVQDSQGAESTVISRLGFVGRPS